MAKTIEQLTQDFLIVSLLGSDHNDINKVLNEKNNTESFHILLNVSLFGKDYSTTIDKKKKNELAIARAYRDFCRTIRKDNNGINKGIGDLSICKDETASIIMDNLEYLNYENYDGWHSKLCKKIIAKKYTYGQAQKWVNMTMKYLIVLGDANVIENIKHLHIPLDTIIIGNALEQKLLTQKTLDDINYTTWSGITEKKQYDAIQKEIKDKLNTEIPIIWEFQAWNESVKNQ